MVLPASLEGLFISTVSLVLFLCLRQSPLSGTIVSSNGALLRRAEVTSLHCCCRWH